MGKFISSASVMCANLARLEEDLQALEAAGADELHFDIMDGLFVPNYTLGFDLIKAAKRSCALPCSAHLMILRPERYIQRFAEAGCDIITVHVEACTHTDSILHQIRSAGAQAGIAINPATPLTALEYLLPLVDRVLIMTVDPGYAGQAIIPSAFERTRILRDSIHYHEHRTQIEVDGNINIENAARLANAGAEIFVLGTSSIFNGPETNFSTTLPQFKKAVAEKQHLI